MFDSGDITSIIYIELMNTEQIAELLRSTILS